MQKKYIVRLTDAEREILSKLVKQRRVSSQKVRRAQVLVKADADGPNWTDAEIADAFDCSTKTVENIRERLVTQGFEVTLNGKTKSRVREKVLDGEQEAKIIALRLGQPPKGFSNWTLRLLAEQAVSLEIVESVSHETLRRTLKKTMIRHWARNPMKTGVSAKLFPEMSYAACVSVKPCRETGYGVFGFALVSSPMADR